MMEHGGSEAMKVVPDNSCFIRLILLVNAEVHFERMQRDCDKKPIITKKNYVDVKKQVRDPNLHDSEGLRDENSSIVALYLHAMNQVIVRARLDNECQVSPSNGRHAKSE